MKNLLVILIGYLIIQPVQAQISNLKEGNLRGKVKSVKLIHQKVIRQNDSIYGQTPPDNDPFWFKGYVDTYTIFDTIGRTIEYHTYFEADADDNKTLNFYDTNGLLKEQHFFADNRKTGSIKYKYDNTQRITEVKRFNEKGKLTDYIRHIRKPVKKIPRNRGKNNLWLYNYDTDGKCIEEKCILPDNKIGFRHQFTYDDKGRQKQSIYHDNDNIQSVTTSFDYDTRGRVQSIIRIGPVEKSISRFKYDLYDNIVYKRVRMVDIPSQRGKTQKEEHCTETQFVFTYDQFGNWIQRIVIQNDIPEYIQVREISYY